MFRIPLSNRIFYLVLSSEASYIDQVNRAKGEAEAIGLVANATAQSIAVIAASIEKNGGGDAVSLKIAEQYVNAFGNLAKTTNTIILPANLSEPGSFIAGSLSIFDQLKSKTPKV